jgi:hypothetical protein
MKTVPIKARDTRAIGCVTAKNTRPGKVCRRLQAVQLKATDVATAVLYRWVYCLNKQ